MPGSGDSVQALKAGIMEIPDVIAINKMDHPAAKTMLNEVRSILSLDRERAWRPPIVLTDATRGENVPELWEEIAEHRAHLETVGAGQSEVEVIGIADTVVLVLMPGSGDSVQALKAGIMEIPDVIAINKMDHPAAKTMLNEVRSILSLDRERAWRPPIVLTEAMRGENVEELWAKIEEHRAHLESEGLLEERRRKNLAGEVFAVASGRAKAHLERAVEDDPELRRLLDEVQRRELDPLSAVREILGRVFKLGDPEDRTDAR
jgi:putative protein kinase ArgK-like GTPase of G3E family